MEDEVTGKNENQDTPQEAGDTQQVFPKTQHLTGMYKNWFLDYASYVNLDRAVPDIRDGLKPVQRRILHSLKELDDGRFNKAANIIGNTMKYHPHGDASIGEALVILGQKDLLVETQGNWGNILTGDRAAAPRYIEARLSKFALEVAFNPKTTVWQSSYDGRNREPVTLPVKFPLLLAQGVDGIGVGLSSKILPHNFIEIIDACIKHLRNEEFEILPDFPTGGMIDVSKYNDGARGGKVRIRARISQEDKKTLVITEIPFGTTTVSLIDSIVVANDKGKIKIKKIEDNTAAKVEIVIHLAPGVSPDTTIDALYAFTACETSISPICCIIDDQKPRFITVHEILEDSVQHTLDLLQNELEIEKAECLEQLHFSTLERIFIENEVYQLIRKSKTDKEIDDTIDKGLKPFTKLFIRKITNEDIHRLRKIPIERISKYNADKAEDIINSLKDDIEQVDYDLDHLVDYAITYYERLKMKYSKGQERKTEIKNFDVIQATMVAIANQKLYVNREEGFIGTGIKKDEYVCDCSDIDDILTFREDGTFMLTKVADKVFVGKNIIHVAVYKRFDERSIYNMVYRDGKNGNAMVKRFAVTGINRDKEYVLTKGTADSKVLYFTANPNGEAEIINVSLRPKPRLKILSFDFDFSTLAIKGRNSIGNILSKNPVKKITLKDSGISTLSERDVWFDESVSRLNTEQRGRFLGSFAPEDKIITFMKSGHFRIYNNDLSIHFDEDLLLIEKYNPEKVYTVIYYDGESGFTFVKRFTAEFSDKKQIVISENTGSHMIEFMPEKNPAVELTYEMKNARSKPSETIDLVEFIGVKSYKAKGKRLSNNQILTITRIITDEPPEEPQAARSQDEISEALPPDFTGGEEDDSGIEQSSDTTTGVEDKVDNIPPEIIDNAEDKVEKNLEQKTGANPAENKSKTAKTLIEKASREEDTLSEKPEKPAAEEILPARQKKGTKKPKGKNDFPGAIQIEFDF